MLHSSSSRAQVTPSICFALILIRDLYKKAVLNSLPTFIKCFSAFFKLAAGAILFSLTVTIKILSVLLALGVMLAEYV